MLDSSSATQHFDLPAALSLDCDTAALTLGPGRRAIVLSQGCVYGLGGLLRPDTATDAADVRPSIGMLRRHQCLIGRWVAPGVLVNAAVEPIAGIETSGKVFVGINFGADDVGSEHL
jgi:hypothetical protein